MKRWVVILSTSCAILLGAVIVLVVVDWPDSTPEPPATKIPATYSRAEVADIINTYRQSHPDEDLPLFRSYHPYYHGDQWWHCNFTVFHEGTGYIAKIEEESGCLLHTTDGITHLSYVVILDQTIRIHLTISTINGQECSKSTATIFGAIHRRWSKEYQLGLSPGDAWMATC